VKRKKIPSGLRGNGCLTVPFFTEDNKINIPEMKRHVEWLIEKNTQTIVPGSVCPGCTKEEALQIWKLSIEAANKRATVMPFLGPRCNSTELFIEDIKIAEDMGFDALYFSLFAATNSVGYHEHPTFLEQLIQPWIKGLEVASLPVMLYNHAGLPWSREPNIPVSTLVELSKNFLNIAGLKTNSPIGGQFAAELHALKPLGLNVAKGLHELEFIGGLALGLDGFISMTGHALPEMGNGIHEAFTKGDVAKAQEIVWQMFPILDVIGTEFPARVEYFPFKVYLIEARGFKVGKLRPPMRPIPKEAQKVVDDTYKKLGIYMDCA